MLVRFQINETKLRYRNSMNTYLTYHSNNIDVTYHTDSRLVIGYVTSGENQNGTSKGVAVALCSSTEVLHMKNTLLEISKNFIPQVNFDNLNILRKDIWCSERFTLVMIHNPYSNWLRPALLETIFADE